MRLRWRRFNRKRCVTLLFICFLGLAILSITYHLKSDDSGHKDNSSCTILIPFRNREEQLKVLLDALEELHPDLKVIVLNQTDHYAFNRGALFNVGVRESGKRCYILHDVDLIPTSRDVPYTFIPKLAPLHLIPAAIHPKYKYPQFFGGIVSIMRDHYYSVNGYSNSYWGWGLEDDDFRRRIGAILRVRPNDIGDLVSPLKLGKDAYFQHYHDESLPLGGRQGDHYRVKFKRFKNQTIRNFFTDGVNNVEYNLQWKEERCLQLNLCYTSFGIQLKCLPKDQDICVL